MTTDDDRPSDGTIGYDAVQAEDLVAPVAPTDSQDSSLPDPQSGSRSGISSRSVFANPHKSSSGSGSGSRSGFGKAAARTNTTLTSEVLIGPYEILDEIGRGGMGVVFKARHIHLNRTVALKMIVGGSRLSEAHLERFRIEAESVAKLHHENIVQVYDVGEHNDAPYIALELVDGGNLARKVEGKPQGPKYAAQMVETLARAVHAAHAAGVVHRDLKPGNVLLTLDGQPKVTDFGLAKNLSNEGADGVEHTHAGSIIGTPSYMAPEQAAGRIHDIGPPSDIYALGAILYELLTGHPPFRGDSPIATIRMVLDGEVVPARQLITTVPKDLDTICLKALQKPTHRRYQTAEEMAEDLRRFLDGEPILARPSGRAERFAKWVRRNPARAATLGTGVAAAVAMLALGVWSYAAVTRRAELAERAQKQAHEALDEGTRRLVRLNVSNGTRLLDDRDYLGAVLWYAEALRLEAGGPDRERMHRVRLKAVIDRCPRPAQVWLHEAALTDAGFDAAGRWLITAGDDGMARVWDAATGAAVGPPMEHGGPVKLATLAPDGRAAATAGADGSLKVWDVRAGRVTFTAGVAVQLTGLTFSPDGTRVAAAGAGGRARVWDPAAGREVSTSQAGSDRACGPAFAPDGTRYVIGTRDGVARVFEAAGGQPVGPPLKHAGPIAAVAFAPDGKRVATASADGTAQTWDAATGQPLLANAPRHADAVTAVRFSPDNRRLVTASLDRTAQVWDADTGLPIGRPVQHASAVLSASFSPDGRWFVTAGDDNTTRVWDAATGQPVTPPFRSNATPLVAAFSPNGYQLLIAAQNRIAKLWDLITPADVRDQPPAGAGPPAGPAPAGVQTVHSPDCEFLATFGGGQAVRVRRAADHEPVTPPLRTGAAGTAAGFSPDGLRIATGDQDGNVQIWDAKAGKPVWEKPGRHASRVLRVTFSPSGDVLATSSEDNTVGVWDAATGRPRVPPIRVGASVYGLEFGLDGEALFTPLPGGTARAWDVVTGQPLTPSVPAVADWQTALTPDDRSADSLGAMGRVFAGQQLDAAGGLVPSDSTVLRDEWVKLRAAAPDDFTASRVAVAAWQKRQAAEAEAAGQWFAAAWHLDRMLAGTPGDGDLRRRRATAAARLGDWQQAADDAGRAVQAQPTNPDNWYQRGVAFGQLGKWDRAAADFAQAVRLRSDPAAAAGLAAKVKLAAGDLLGYRQACKELLAARPDDPRAALLAAWVCVLSPENGADPAVVLDLAEAGLKSNPGDDFAVTVRSAALIRAGRGETAIDSLKGLAAADTDRPAAWLFYAIALTKQGKTTDARPWRAKAEAWLAKGESPGAVPPTWDQRAEVEILLREAGR